MKKKEMITYKKLLNLDLTIYDNIFLDRKFFGKTLQDFASFKELLNNIKEQYNQELLNQQIFKKLKIKENSV